MFSIRLRDLHKKPVLARFRGGLNLLMSSLLVLAIAGSFPLRAAEPNRSNDTLRMFANCAGRISAELEFTWLTGRNDSDQLRHQQAYVRDLIESVMPPDGGHWVLTARIQAKSAHSTLLSRSYFNDNPRDAEMARRLAERHRTACRSFMIG